MASGTAVPESATVTVATGDVVGIWRDAWCRPVAKGRNSTVTTQVSVSWRVRFAQLSPTTEKSSGWPTAGSIVAVAPKVTGPLAVTVTSRCTAL